MDDELQKAWEKLQLSDEEEEVVAYEGELSTEKRDEVRLSLMGKLHTEKSFNVRGMKSVLKNVWKAERGLVRKDFDANLFLFQFFSPADKAHALNEGPWAYDGNIMLLKEITGLEQPSEIIFDTARFWVKAYDVPVVAQISSYAQFLASSIGTYVGVEDTIFCGADKSMCFQVNIDVNKPLKKGLKTILEGKQIWIKFRYIKLPDYCYGCGKLGHVWRGCVFYDEAIPEEKLKYSEDLRASPRKTKRRGYEIEMKEEKKLFNDFRKGKRNNGACKKLCYGQSKEVKIQGGDERKAGDDNVNMIVDEMAVVAPPNEALKRKFEDHVASHSQNRPEAA